MGALARFGTGGFRVVADNAVDFIAATQAAGAGHVAANVQEMATTLNTSLVGIDQRVGALRQTNIQGFERVTSTLSADLTGLKWLNGASVLVQAAGFAVVAKQLSDVKGEITALGDDLRAQGRELIDAQRAGNRHLEAIEDFARAQLDTSQKILETLASSRRVEATQLIEQGWANLVNGYREEALQRFEQSLEFDNTVYLPHAELAEIYEQSGDLKRAEGHFRKASDFSRDVEGDASGFSLLRLVRFLADHHRLDEAAPVLEEGVETGRLDHWKLGAAESAIRVGLPDLALEQVREAIVDDDDAFVAAIGSEPLSALGPRLAGLLIELDTERRGPILALIQDCSLKFPSIEALGEAGFLSSVRVADFRARAAALLEESLLAGYTSLAGVAERAGALRSEAEQLSTEATAGVIRRSTVWLKSWEAAYSRNEWPWQGVPSVEPGQLRPRRQLGQSEKDLITVTTGIVIWFVAGLVFGGIFAAAGWSEGVVMPVLLAAPIGIAAAYMAKQENDKPAPVMESDPEEDEAPPPLPAQWAAALRYEAMVADLYEVAKRTAAADVAELAENTGSTELQRVAEGILSRELLRDWMHPRGAGLTKLSPPTDARAAAESFGAEVPGSVCSVWMFLEYGDV